MVIEKGFKSKEPKYIQKQWAEMLKGYKKHYKKKKKR